MQLIKKKIIYRDSNEPYLIRYSVFTCRWFAIKIHNILLSDDNCLHDHPWAFISFILKGGYWEHTPAKDCAKHVSESAMSYFTDKKWHGRFRLLYRHVHSIHRLELPQGKTAWTLVITFKKRKPWGFFTPSGWVEWFKYKAEGGCQ